MRSGLFLLLTLFSFCSFGQWLPSDFNLDTIRYAFRTGGKLDSVDYSIGRTSGTQPGGSIDFQENFPTSKFLLSYRGGCRILFDDKVRTLKFSALPHLGFSYTFGTQGTQVATMNYQQIFAKRVLVNLDFKNDRGNGFLRNSEHRLNEIDLSIAKKGKKWSFDLEFQDYLLENGLNDGITADSDPESFPLQFLAVSKANASSKIRSSKMELTNYLDFISDTIRSLGILTHHHLLIQGRQYTEEDTIFGLYPMVNFDPFSTSDAFQLSKTMHGVGGFVRNKRLYADARINGVYWKYFNRGKDHDTLEANVQFNLQSKIGEWHVKNSTYLNLVGAGGEWSTQFALTRRFKKIRWNSSLEVEELWPHQFQRFYFANNYDYSLGQTIEKQFKLHFENRFSLNLSSIELEFNQSSSLLNDQYFYAFASGNWSNDLIPNIVLQEFGLRAHWNYKILTIQPEYRYTYESGLNNNVPDHVVKLRTMVKGSLFKSRKMVAYTGFDMIWFSKASTISFIPSLDTYLFNGAGTEHNGMLNLHLFGGFQIDEFRFFVRFENLGYQWTSSSIELLDGYTIPSSQLRVGLTWDFFN